MLGFYNYTVILTYIGMLTGFTGITCVMAGNKTGALLCLLVAGLCDMFDGKIASTMVRTKQERYFGIQIDSLSDLICFGVLPALIVYSAGTGSARIIPSAVYVLCALIRLAWFNVNEQERQDIETGSRKIYFGLPVTTSALIIPITISLCDKYNRNSGQIGVMVLIAMAVAFLTPFEIKKPKLAGKISLILLGAFGILAALMGGMDI